MFECPICYKSRRKISTLNCNHQICFFCWEKWKNKELTVYERMPTCPICRAPQSNLQSPKWAICIAIGLTWYWYSSRLLEIETMA